MQPATHPLYIANPNGSVMQSTHTAELPLPTIPLEARRTHVVPDLASASLFSIGQLCDSGCTVTFTQKDFEAKHNDKVVLTGHRAPDQLWHLDPQPFAAQRNHQAHHLLSAAPAPPAHNIINAQSNASIATASPAEQVAFAHASLFSPPLSTLEAALQHGFLTNFPGLTIATLRKYPPKTIATAKGHLDQVRKNAQSTKKHKPSPRPPAPNPTLPTKSKNSTLAPIATSPPPYPRTFNHHVKPLKNEPMIALRHTSKSPTKPTPTSPGDSSFPPTTAQITYSFCTTTTATAFLLRP